MRIARHAPAFREHQRGEPAHDLFEILRPPGKAVSFNQIVTGFRTVAAVDRRRVHVTTHSKTPPTRSVYTISCSCSRRACSPLFAQKTATKVAGYMRSKLAPLWVLAINRRSGWIGCRAGKFRRDHPFCQS